LRYLNMYVKAVNSLEGGKARFFGDGGFVASPRCVRLCRRVPRISNRQPYGGADARIERLGLTPLWDELEKILTGFQLLVLEEVDSNGGAAVRRMIDREFEKAGGWKKKQTGDVDWTKCLTINGARVCLGVEIQMSLRSDMLIIDVDHLRQQIIAGSIDVGVLVTNSDRLAVFLTDRAAYFSAATRTVERARAHDLPILVIGLEHDGAGAALAKQSKAPSGQGGKKRKRNPPQSPGSGGSQDPSRSGVQ